LNPEGDKTLPVERSAKFELAINPKTAKHIGVATPADALGRADRIVR
jgi:ABC-type uncharacterized transport system substrate-binding protein